MPGVTHHGEGLALDLEARDDLFGVHPNLHDLECHAPAHGLGLLGFVDHTHAALAEDSEDPVGSEAFWVIGGVGRPSGR